MSIIVIRQYYNIKWPLGNPLEYAFLSEDDGTGDTTQRTLVAPDGSILIVTGTDLTLDENELMLVSGTVTGVELYFDGDLLLSMSGSAIDVAAALAAYNEDPEAPYPLGGPNDSVDFDASYTPPDDDGFGVGRFEASANADSLVGSEGAETIAAFEGNDTIWGLGGNDTLYGDDGDDSIYGGDGHDELQGWTGNDTMFGGEGNDQLYGYTGHDSLSGGNGADWIEGGDGSDTLDGGSGNDMLKGEAGTDTLLGGSGNDSLWGGAGADKLDGGSGSDFAYYGDKSKKVEVALNGSKEVSVKVNGVVEDKIKNIEGVVGGSAGDKLVGDKLGNYFFGLGGKDTIDGGKGLDMADFSDKAKKVQVTLNGSKEVTVKVNGKSEDKIKNIEGIIGGTAGDKITGDSASNWLIGNRGNDTLSGGSGKDTLVGGEGKDVLTGGASADRFVFDTYPTNGNSDKITDFKHNSDKIALEADIFSFLGSSVSKSELAFGKSAKDANDFLIYDKKTGNLYVDPDGNGSTYGKYLIATLTNKATLDHGDFIIV